MAYITIVTAAGHRLMVQPKRQRLMMFDLQDAAVAESRLDERRLIYARYRYVKEMPAAELGIHVTFAQSVKRDFSYLGDDEFREIDNGVIELSKNPCPADSKVKHYKWFKGNLRRKMIGNYPLIYTLPNQSDRIVLLRLGVRRWSEVPTNPSCSPSGGHSRNEFTDRDNRPISR
jgi:mRNA-degrading endonuclease RelE of RelBE toxin-antitoxin system